jgi:ATP-binding cassette subfamily G (WHITE) protein 2 (SNQ2)
MMNEFGRIDLTCEGTSLIPYGEGYGDIKYQVCTLPGSVAGNPQVSGNAYIEQGFSYTGSDLWRNWGIIIVLIVGFLFLNTTLGEYIKWGAGGKTITFFAKEDKERKELNEALHAKKERRGNKEADEGSSLSIDSKAVLTWEELCYDVPVPSGELQELVRRHYWTC